MAQKNRLNIQGTKPSTYNSQLLVSTGIPALDELLGGGVAVGTILLIDEDLHGTYAKVLLKYFIAEGVVNKHASLVASLDCNPKIDIVSDLPAATNRDVDSDSLRGKNDNKMQIAFRYQSLPTSEKSIKSQFGHYYDLSKQMTSEQINETSINYFSSDNLDEAMKPGILENNSYNNLLKTVINTVKDDRFLLDDHFDKKNILRICVHRLGSPNWSIEDDARDIKKFLYYLRCIMRKCFGVAVISVPAHISSKLRKVYDKRLVHISDVALKLEMFAGTKLEKIEGLSENHGYFHIIKLASINSLASKHPGSVEYVFKLKRKKFCIQMLHLPPCVEDPNDGKKQETPSFGCGSSTKHLMEF